MEVERKTRAQASALSGAYARTALLAVTFPALLAVDFWRSASWRHRHWIITIFFTVFGSVVLLGTGDGYRIQRGVEFYYAEVPFTVWLDDLWRILTFQFTDGPSKDLYRHLASYFFGGVLGAPQLFFPFVAFVYGYFYAGSVLHVLRHFNLSTANYVILSFVFVFLFVKGLEGFYTVRTWTGLWILVYATLKYYEERRLRYALLMFVPPFIHIGFFVMAIPAWIVLFFGNRVILYTGIFLVSSVTTVLPVQDVTSFIAQTERGEHQVRAYSREQQSDAVEDFQRIREETNFYNAYRRAGLQRWAPTVLVFALLASGAYLRFMTPYQRSIFSIGILTLALSNMTWFLFAVHNRTLTIAMVFILAAFLLARLDPETKKHFQALPPWYTWGLHLSLLLFVPLMMFQVSVVMDRMSVFVFGFPFVVWLFPELNLSVKEALNMLLGRG